MRVTPEAWSHSEINLHWAQGFAHAHWLALGFVRPLADALNKKNRSQRAIYSCCSLRFPSLPSALLLLTIWHSYTLMFFLPSALASASPSLFCTDFIHRFTWEAIRTEPNQPNESRNKGIVDPKMSLMLFQTFLLENKYVFMYSVFSVKIVLDPIDFHWLNGSHILKISSFVFQNRTDLKD